MDINIYPNPTRDRIYTAGIRSNTLMEIFTMDGRQLMTHQLNADRFFSLSSDFGLATGIYMLRLESEGKTFTKKIVVE